jgi:type II secretory pathway component PulC
MNIELHFKKGIKAPVLGGEVLSFMHPVREWFLGVGVCISILIIGGAYIAYDFYAQFDASGTPVVTEEQGVIYREDEVREYAKLYTERDQAFQTLRAKRVVNTQPVVVPNTSPSISLDLPLVNE